MLARLRRHAAQPVDGASLAVLRIAFGLCIAIEATRYLALGWVRAFYVDPSFFFGYPGFEWIVPWRDPGPYLHVALVAVAGVLTALGLAYRPAAATACTGLAVWFLWDASRYQNHTYLFVLVAFLLAVVPAHRALSVHAWRAARRGVAQPALVPRWSLWLLRFQVAVPYVFGGLAKLESDWLQGRPLGAWVAEHSDWPFAGPLLAAPHAGRALALAGLALDLAIVPALLVPRSRPFAFATCVSFHLANAALFEIGLFPWFMIAASTVFFEPAWPRRWLRGARALAAAPAARLARTPPRAGRAIGLPLATSLALWVALQIALPLRSFFLPGNPSWTERGQRFAWRMKLREKTGTAQFVAIDPTRGEIRTIDPRDFLTSRQAAHMSTQPDLIAQFARHVAALSAAQGHPIEVHADVRLSLNGRPPAPLVDPKVDLATVPQRASGVAWILPLPEPAPASEAGP